MSNLVPEGWSRELVGSFVQLTSGKSKVKSSLDEVKGRYSVPVYGGNGINGYCNEVLLNDATVVIGRVGEYCGCVHKTVSQAWVTDNALYIKKLNSNYDLDFVYQLLDFSELSKLRKESGQPLVSQQPIYDLSVFTPPFPEQKKIAAILTSVDEVIEKTQAQIDKLKDLKTGMMQELLTRGVGVDDKPHTEFTDSPVGRIPKGWEVVKFKDIFHTYKYGPRFSSKDYDELGNVKTIRGTDLSSNGVIKYSQVPVAKLDSKLVTQNALNHGDLVMITTADCGATAVFESQSIPYIASAYAIKLTPKKGLNSKYINYFMQTDEALSQVDSFVRKGTVANLPGSDVMSMILALPPFDEQNQVVRILEKLDENITLKLEVLDSKKSLKKALMQDLLTGKKRVKVEG